MLVMLVTGAPSVARSGSLSPVLRGEGWGEGRLCKVAQFDGMAPHPNPLPEYREEGTTRFHRPTTILKTNIAPKLSILILRWSRTMSIPTHLRV